MAEERCLEGHGLGCERDDRILFRGLHFSVRSGEVLRLEGPNGAGKTTLLKMLVGLFPLQAGSLSWAGKALSGNWQGYLSSLIYLGHQTGIKGVLSPIENLQFWTRARGESYERSHLLASLEAVGLGAFAMVPCEQLSAGQQRRAALARLYLGRHPLWLLDEAFTSIDRQGVEQLEGHLADHARQGGLVILTTHHVLSERLPCRSLLLQGGQSPRRVPA